MCQEAPKVQRSIQALLCSEIGWSRLRLHYILYTFNSNINPSWDSMATSDCIHIWMFSGFRLQALSLLTLGLSVSVTSDSMASFFSILYQWLSFIEYRQVTKRLLEEWQNNLNDPEKEIDKVSGSKVTDQLAFNLLLKQEMLPGKGFKACSVRIQHRHSFQQWAMIFPHMDLL